MSHCVWLYFRFCLSDRDVEELMAECGVLLTYEAVRYWCRTFGQAYANQLRPRRHRLSAPAYRQAMSQRFQIWREVTAFAPAA